MQYLPILVLGCHILAGSPLIVATVGKTLLSILFGCTAMSGLSSSFQEERSMPTLVFCLLLVDEIELVFGTKSGLLDVIKEVTYTTGLNLFVKEGTSEASTVWIMSTNYVNVYKITHT
jgi:hypothetical protein